MPPHSRNYSYVYDPPHHILPAKSETLHKPYYLLWHIIISLVKSIYEKSKDVKSYNYSDNFIAVHSSFTAAFVISQAGQAGTTQELL